jgi:hypothetical protein
MKTEKFTHAGTSYEVHYLFGREALTMSYRLAKYVGPSLASMAGGGTVDLSNAANSFFANCAESDFTDFTEAMFKNCLINGKPGEHHWAEHFRGKPGELYQVLIKIVKVQFADFFQGLIDSAEQKPATESVKATLID